MSLRFGLFALDPKDKSRTPRAGVSVYQKIIAHRGISQALLDAYGDASK